MPSCNIIWSGCVSTMLRAVIFDSDGTLLDSFELIYAAHVHAARVHGQRPPTREVFRSHLGKSLLQIYKDSYPEGNHTGMIEANGTYLVEHLTEVMPFAGLHALLQQLQDMGLKLALLTGGNHRIHDLLTHQRIAHQFSSIVHFERTRRPKPDAEGFLLTAKECGVKPNEAVMVGDTIIDMQTGHNAGALASIGVTHGIASRKQLKAAGADYLVNSLPELSTVLLRLHATA